MQDARKALTEKRARAITDEDDGVRLRLATTAKNKMIGKSEEGYENGAPSSYTTR